jgi:hypothetical protein
MLIGRYLLECVCLDPTVSILVAQLTYFLPVKQFVGGPRLRWEVRSHNLISEVGNGFSSFSHLSSGLLIKGKIDRLVKKYWFGGK